MTRKSRILRDRTVPRTSGKVRDLNLTFAPSFLVTRTFRKPGSGAVNATQMLSRISFFKWPWSCRQEKSVLPNMVKLRMRD
ncbi:Apoptosis Facilitator Bcl-2-Like Protein 14 [Manis pentadactyla]|nr:Apoptosis Facilitator Bcl-2-Like Protein 14 [Manis pentadactyla]